MFGMPSTKSCGIHLGRAEATFNAARAARAAGEFDKALSLTLIAQARAEAARAWPLVRQSLDLAGDLLVALDEPAQAIVKYEQALTVARNQRADLHTLLNLIPLLHDQGRSADAYRAASQACSLAERLHEPPLFSLAVHWLACLDYDQGHWSDAEAHFHAALTASHLVGEPSPATAASLLLDLGNSIAQQQRLAEARPWLEQSVAAAELAGDTALSVDTRHSLAVVCALAHDADRATRLLSECITLLQGLGDSAGCAEMGSELARVVGRPGLPPPALTEIAASPAPRRVVPAVSV